MKQDSIPPLPDLEIDKITKTKTDQETIDKILKAIYAERPDFFVRMAEREGQPRPDPDNFVIEFMKYLEIKIPDYFIQSNDRTSTTVYWEVRRRARFMYGMGV